MIVLIVKVIKTKVLSTNFSCLFSNHFSKIGNHNVVIDISGSKGTLDIINILGTDVNVHRVTLKTSLSP